MDENLNGMNTINYVLDNVRRFAGETFVIKFGGSFLTQDYSLDFNIAKSIILLKQVGVNPIVVHGGGRKISESLDKMSIKSSFVDGLRITTEPVMEVVEMVLSGYVNKYVVSLINSCGGNAVGISGRDGNLVVAKKIKKVRKCIHSNIEEMIDLGSVGEPESIDPDLLLFLEDSPFIPVISPVCSFSNGSACNVNSDMLAGSLAISMSALKLIMMTDVEGIKRENGDVVQTLSVKECNSLIEKRVIEGGMIPKVKSCIDFLENGCGGTAHIINGNKAGALFMNLFLDFHGTTITEGL